MSNISQVDKNFKVDTNINKPDIRTYNINEPPFSIHGVVYENGMYRRMPESVANSVSEGVSYLHMHTSGGRVRFRTDSSYLAVLVKLRFTEKMSHFPLTGSIGLDVYVRETEDEKPEYIDVFIPPYDVKDAITRVVELGESKMREITINLPLYSGVVEMYVGIRDTALLEAPFPYKIEKPAVFYGSSITQGACASRPGNTYQNRLSREFSFDYISLGFSGNARGEIEIAEYINNLDMSMFVYDYDHNAPSLEHLQATHERMFKTIRSAHPNLPIIIMSRPKFHLSDHEKERLGIIRKTYENALASGDNNVYFLSGKELMALAEADGTVDVCHPNDFGFASMSMAISKLIKDNHIL